MNKKCVKKCISSPPVKTTNGEADLKDSANSVLVNFHKKRSVPKEIPSEVEVSVVKTIVITWDDCITMNQLFDRLIYLTDQR